MLHLFLKFLKEKENKEVKSFILLCRYFMYCFCTLTITWLVNYFYCIILFSLNESMQ